ncbi:MAG: hypothetical protein ACK4M7_05785 [Burkholderiales bacterium]
MLKKLLKKSALEESEAIFPQPFSAKAKQTDGGGNKTSNSLLTQVEKSACSLDEIIAALASQEEFMQILEVRLTSKLLDILLAKYGFEPTDKYKEEIENRKQYISQLDAYLQERKEINTTVESELQQFLHETTCSLTKALETFSQSIQHRIHNAEAKYGIDAVRNTLLNESIKK